MQMVDVMKKLKEIEERSPEISHALDNAQRMSGQSKVVEEGVKITVSGSDAVLHQILKLAGMIGADTEEAPEMGSQVMIGMMDEEDDNRPWETSPHEVITDPSTAFPAGSDLHAAKGTYPKVAGADNPMALPKI
jgi:hypothetical protein